MDSAEAASQRLLPVACQQRTLGWRHQADVPLSDLHWSDRPLCEVLPT